LIDAPETVFQVGLLYHYFSDDLVIILSGEIHCTQYTYDIKEYPCMSSDALRLVPRTRLSFSLIRAHEGPRPIPFPCIHWLLSCKGDSRSPKRHLCIQERPNSSKICHGTKAETDEPEEVYHYGHSQSRFGSEMFTGSGLDTWTIIPSLNAAPLRPLDAQYDP